VRSTTLRATVLALALAVVATGCSGSRGASPSDTSGDQTAATTKTASTDQWGDLPMPCSGGDAVGATDQGVTDTSITIGYGDDAGFPQSPGLNHQMADAVKAMIEWCNAQGGINGRQVVGNYHDAKILDVNNAVSDACSKDFFLVGEGFSLDSSGEATRRACGLPAVPGFAVSAPLANGPQKWEPLPVPADYVVASAGAQLAKLYPEQVKKAATIYGNYPATTDSRNKVVAAYSQFGWEFLPCDQIYNIQGEADWKPFAQKLKDCGAEVVYWSGSPYPNLENLLDAAHQLGFDPIWVAESNVYDDAFAQWNATSGFADKVYFRLSLVPLFEAAASPATQQYLDAMEASGGDPAALGVQSASAFLLWATAAKACGSDLTRTCMAGKLDAVTDWTGGGLHAASQPGPNLPTDCGALFKLTRGDFERVTPTAVAAFECDPSFATKITGPVVDAAKLDANREAQL
jgi:ABC-type branched-subunit amino acid transport system substrate-binding protein